MECKYESVSGSIQVILTRKDGKVLPVDYLLIVGKTDKINEHFKFSRYEYSFIWLKETGVALPVFCCTGTTGTWI